MPGIVKKTLHILLLAQLLVLLSSCGQVVAQKIQGADSLPTEVSQFLSHLTPEYVIDCEPPFAQFVLPNTGSNSPESVHSVYTEEEIEEEVDNSGKKRLEASKYFSASFGEDAVNLKLFDNAVITSLNNYISYTYSHRCYILFQVFRL